MQYPKSRPQLFFFQAEDGIRDQPRSRGLGDVYKRQMYMSQYGVPEVLFYPSLVFEFIVPLVLIAGFKTRIVASVLFLFVLTVTLIFHTDFGNSMQLISFLKNTAIMGGLLIIISNKPQMCSIDYYLESKKGN